MLRTAMIVVLLLLALPAAAQETKDEKEFRGQDAQRVAAWLKVSQDHAADYRLTFADNPDAPPLKLLPKAVFRHSQPVRGDDIGAVYLWVDEAGLPAALGSVFAYTFKGGSGERWVAHEFHSLAAAPLIGKWRGDDAWSPDVPGVEWKEVPEAPTKDKTVPAEIAPAETANARLRQMRQIGRRLAAHSTDSSDSRWELRLITQPIYQYPPEKPNSVSPKRERGTTSESPKRERGTAEQSPAPSNTIGGGVFLFCQGTDPEVILLLEARQSGDRRTWHYALAPFTDYGLSVTLDSKEVWSLEKGHRPTLTTAHWWNGRMETKKLSAKDEAELAKAFEGERKDSR